MPAECRAADRKLWRLCQIALDWAAQPGRRASALLGEIHRELAKNIFRRVFACRADDAGRALLPLYRQRLNYQQYCSSARPHAYNREESSMRKAFLVFPSVGLLYFATVARAQTNPCDLNQDGTVNVADVQLAINMSLGQTVCSANIYGTGVCNVVVVQRVTNAALGGACVTGTTVPHSVSLSWTASGSANVVGYNIYRGTTSGGPYTKLTASPVAGLAYTDTSVQAGQTYYYVATTVDSNNNESAYSTQTQATVPTP